MIKLKRCSKCGGKAVLPQRNSGFGRITFNYIVMCRNFRNCKCSAIGNTKLEAIAAWNRRTK